MTVMETRLAILRVDVSKENGEVMLLIETACGFRPVIGWPNVSGFQDFTNTLVDICSQISFKGRSNDMTCSDDI